MSLKNTLQKTQTKKNNKMTKNDEKIILKNIELDEEIYPRSNFSQKTIENYFDAMMGGAVFPPIKVQRVMVIDEDDEENIITIIIDGYHRIEAYKLYLKECKDENITPDNELRIDEWKKEVLDYASNFEELLIESTLCNMGHGDRLKESDIEKTCLKIVENRDLDGLKGIVNELAKLFNLTKGRMSQLIGSEVSSRKATRDDKIYRLLKSGFTQQQVANVFNLSQPAVIKIITKFNIKLSNILELGMQENKSFRKLAEQHNLHHLTLYIKYMEDKDDLERFKIFGQNEQEKKQKVYDIWNFQNRDNRLGIKAKGNIAGQTVMNVLYYYTKDGDIVLDPMAGGGSTIDACMIMNRKCVAYDLKPLRDDITKNDSVKSIPEQTRKTSLVFLDPPYYDMIKEIQNYKDTKDFYEQINSVVKNSIAQLKKDGYVALIIGNLTSKQETCISVECFKILEKNNLKFVNHISVPHSTEQYNGAQVKMYKDKKQIIAINRELYVFKKL